MAQPDRTLIYVTEAGSLVWFYPGESVIEWCPDCLEEDCLEHAIGDEEIDDLAEMMQSEKS